MSVHKYSQSRLQDRAPRGRATAVQPTPRYQAWQREADANAAGAVATQLIPDAARSLISYHRSPDLPFDRSINPYRGCEHACIYCYARPGHAYLDLSPGLDFETRIVYRPDAAAILKRELAAPGYRCAPLALGGSTDAWQPVERKLGLTREIVKVLLEHRHPLSVVTKSALIERDLDLLSPLAEQGLLRVTLSITSLDDALALRLEPRAPRPARRLQTVAALHAAGVPVGVFFAPVIPGLTDHELENVLAAAAQAGADAAGYILLRLPGEVEGLFTDWLARHVPERARHVLSLLRQCRNGSHDDPRFAHRMRGEGPIAALLAQRLALALKRHRLRPLGQDALRTDLFRIPGQMQQGELFAPLA